MKVLMGYDGSDCAKAAIEDLVLAGLPSNVDARVLSVADLLVKLPYEDYPLTAVPDERPTAEIVRTARALAADAMREAQEASAEGVELVASLFPGWTARAEAVADSPYWALIKAAEDWRADLIVVGSQGRGALGRAFLGSVSQNVLGHATCSVRVGRARERSAAPPRIILAVDGSPDSDVAVAEVARRFWPAGTMVRVVTAVHPKLAMAVAFVAACAPGHQPDEDAATAARRYAAAAVQRLSDRGLAATPLVEERDPKRLLLDQAEHWRADCIFVGARGHRRLERALLGSVSASVAARATCSVEVMRAPNGPK